MQWRGGQLVTFTVPREAFYVAFPFNGSMGGKGAFFTRTKPTGTFEYHVVDFYITLERGTHDRGAARLERGT